MHVYVAAPWSHKDDARAFADKLVAAGHTISEPWWDHPPSNDHEELVRQATKDIQGVAQCDLIVVLQLALSEGKAFETGMAAAWEKPIIVMNPTGVRGDTDAVRSGNLFHHLMPVVASEDEVVTAINTMQAAYEAWLASQTTQTTEGKDVESNG